jgi:hypothetical protein
MTNVSQQPMTQQRSRAAERAHSAGTVALVLGCLHAIPGFYKVAQGALASAQVVHAELPIAAQRMMIASARVGLIQESAMFSMDLALIGVALLLRRGHAWSRPLGFAWALAALAVLVGRAAMFEVHLLPAATTFFEGPFPVDVRTWLRASTYVGLSLLAAFPVLFLGLLHWARRPSRVRA